MSGPCEVGSIPRLPLAASYDLASMRLAVATIHISVRVDEPSESAAYLSSVHVPRYLMLVTNYVFQLRDLARSLAISTRVSKGNSMVSVPGNVKRDISVDSLRGLAVILMVAGHVVGSTGDAGMRVADESAWRWFYLMLEDIRMPLFTVLSGFVYAMRPLRQSSGYGKMLKGKARRLLVPLLVVGTFFYLSQVVLPGTNHAPPLSEIWRVYLYGYGHFWFLLALWFIFMLVPLLDVMGALRTPLRWVVVLLAASAAFVLIPHPSGADLLASFGALRLLPFFLLGYGLKIHAAALHQKVLLGAAILVGGIGVIMKISILNGDSDASSVGSKTVAIVIGMCVLFTVLFFKAGFQIKWLAWLGQCSFGIYLLHVFGTAGARIVLTRIGLEHSGVVFAVSLIAGVVVPVVFELLLGHYRVVSWGVLGQKPRARNTVLAVTR